MLRSEISTLLGIRYPVFQGGMAWIANAKLAAAVSEAGGLGIISAMNTDSEWLRAEIRKTRALTDKPFGVNIMLMSPVAGEMARVVIEEGVPVVTTGAGNPAKYMEGWRSAGINVIPVVASVAFARLMERIGASAVRVSGVLIVQGSLLRGFSCRVSPCRSSSKALRGMSRASSARASASMGASSDSSVSSNDPQWMPIE